MGWRYPTRSWSTASRYSLVANGPAWHDRFPTLDFDDHSPNYFPQKDVVVSYFEKFAKKINAPVRSNVNVEEVLRDNSTQKFLVKTSEGNIEADNIVVATGAFQKPIIPPIVPDNIDITQMHSQFYKNPHQLKEGAVLVIGSGSSGSQVAQEIMLSGRKVFLSIGPHNRPPRRYRGKDNVWWFGALGVWQKKTPDPNTQHVTIAVSGYDGGKTIDFRKFANQGMSLVGLTKNYENGKLYFENDLKINLLQRSTGQNRGGRPWPALRPCPPSSPPQHQRGSTHSRRCSAPPAAVQHRFAGPDRWSNG